MRKIHIIYIREYSSFRRLLLQAFTA